MLYKKLILSKPGTPILRNFMQIFNQFSIKIQSLFNQFSILPNWLKSQFHKSPNWQDSIFILLLAGYFYIICHRVIFILLESGYFYIISIRVILYYLWKGDFYIISSRVISSFLGSLISSSPASCIVNESFLHMIRYIFRINLPGTRIYGIALICFSSFKGPF